MYHHVPLFVPLRVCLRVLGNSQDNASFPAAFKFLASSLPAFDILAVSPEPANQWMMCHLHQPRNHPYKHAGYIGFESFEQGCSDWGNWHEFSQSTMRFANGPNKPGSKLPKPKTIQCLHRFGYYQPFVKWLSKSSSAIWIRTVWNCLVSTISYDGYRRCIPLLL